MLERYGPAKELPKAGGSWVWRHGWEVLHLKTGESCWLCRRCYLNGRFREPYKVRKGLSRVSSHLRNTHRAMPPTAPPRYPSMKPQEASVSVSSKKNGLINNYWRRFVPSEVKGPSFLHGLSMITRHLELFN